MGGVIAGDGNPVDEVLLALLNADCDVDHRAAVDVRRTLLRYMRTVAVPIAVSVGRVVCAAVAVSRAAVAVAVRIVRVAVAVRVGLHVEGGGRTGAWLKIRKQRHLVVAQRAVQFPGRLKGFADVSLAVVLPRLQFLENLGHPERVDHVVAVEVDLADPVALTLLKRNAQPQAPALTVGRHLEILEIRLPHLGVDVSLVPVERHETVGVLLELRLLVGAPSRYPGEPPALLGVLHLAAQLAVAVRLVSDEGDFLDEHLRALVQMKRELHGLRPAGELRHLVIDLRELVPLVGEHEFHERLDPFEHPQVEERIDPDAQAVLLHRRFDVASIDLVRPLEGDDLHPLALFEVEDHPLADHAVRPRLVHHFNPEIVQKAGVPEPLEILADDPLGLRGIRHPLFLRRQAAVVRYLHVVEIRLGIDAGRVSLVRERHLHRAQQVRRILRGHRRGPPPGLGGGRFGRCLRAAGRCGAGRRRRPGEHTRQQPDAQIRS